MLNPQRIERALTHALESSLGKQLKPLTHRGTNSEPDLEAIAALHELRQHLGIEKGETA